MTIQDLAHLIHWFKKKKKEKKLNIQSRLCDLRHLSSYSYSFRMDPLLLGQIFWMVLTKKPRDRDRYYLSCWLHLISVFTKDTCFSEYQWFVAPQREHKWMWCEEPKDVIHTTPVLPPPGRTRLLCSDCTISERTAYEPHSKRENHTQGAGWRGYCCCTSASFSWGSF